MGQCILGTLFQGTQVFQVQFYKLKLKGLQVVCSVVMQDHS